MIVQLQKQNSSKVMMGKSTDGVTYCNTSHNNLIPRWRKRTNTATFFFLIYWSGKGILKLV